MISPFEPLTEAEFDELDDFLLNRGLDEPEEVFEESQDEGILDISELDGFFTAVVSGPRIIQPSRWLPEVWGDVEPVWESTEDFERISSMMIRLMNGIAESLMAGDDSFEPIFMEREVEGKHYTVVDEWCFGYMRGFRLWGVPRQDIDEEMMELLGPINLFTKEIGWELLRNLPQDQVEGLQQEIAPSVRAIHAYWLARRDEFDRLEPVVNTEPKVGRNDPCPCGSGKKYKKCCLH